MTLVQVLIVVLLVTAVAIYYAPKLVEWRDKIKDRIKDRRLPDVDTPAPMPDASMEARVKRMLLLIDLIKQLEAVGAKAAAARLKGAASTLVEDDFLEAGP